MTESITSSSHTCKHPGQTAVLSSGTVTTLDDYLIDLALEDVEGQDRLARAELKCPDCGRAVMAVSEPTARFVHADHLPIEQDPRQTADTPCQPAATDEAAKPAPEVASNASEPKGGPMFGAEKASYTFFSYLIEAGLHQSLVGAVLFDQPQFLNGLTVHDALDARSMAQTLMDNKDHYLTGKWRERSISPSS
ncbi:MAG: hypothetical protein ABJN42_19935 [Roseibium sp.]|uniref:hypothetical protein n=1 Tax=Roseibium sp. TaxID=1936156 RepID=UPI00329A51E5